MHVCNDFRNSSQNVLYNCFGNVAVEVISKVLPETVFRAFQDWHCTLQNCRTFQNHRSFQLKNCFLSEEYLFGIS